jgi:hypothetical protein
MRIQLRAGPSKAMLTYFEKDKGETVLDILEKLSFSHDIQRANEEHPLLQVFFDNLAAEVSREAGQFEEIQMVRWMARHRQYARQYLIGSGQRDTAEQVRDTLVLVFGEDLAGDEPAKERVTRVIHRGQLAAELPAKAIDVRIAELRNDGSYGQTMDALHASIWADVNQGYTFEAMTELGLSLQSEVAKAKALSAAFQARGFRISDFIRILNSGPGGNLSPGNFVKS